MATSYSNPFTIMKAVKSGNDIRAALVFNLVRQLLTDVRMPAQAQLMSECQLLLTTLMSECQLSASPGAFQSRRAPTAADIDAYAVAT